MTKRQLAQQLQAEHDCLTDAHDRITAMNQLMHETAKRIADLELRINQPTRNAK